MSPITTHVLDTGLGSPASGVAVFLEYQKNETTWLPITEKETNRDGRVSDLISNDEFNPGVYRITFETASYFKKNNIKTFYPYASIVFEVKNSKEHYHVPLLISGHGYSTYRGS